MFQISSIPLQCVTKKSGESGSIEKAIQKIWVETFISCLLLGGFSLRNKTAKSKKGAFKEMKTYALLGAVGLITSSASAIFTGWTTSVAAVYGTQGWRDVYSVYANFSNDGAAGSNARMLNIFDFGKADSTPEGNQIANGTSGIMSAVHNDNAISINSIGTWEAGADAFNVGSDQFLTDSYVTMKGIGNNWGTILDPSFTEPSGLNAGTIPITAGWYTSSPATPYLVGTTLKYKVLQIAHVAGCGNVFTANMTLGYAAFGQFTPLFGYGSFTIPAPGAMALLGLAGAFGRRRRS